MSTETIDGFGTPIFDSGKRSFPEGPKKGSQEWRILPPILSQVATGKFVLPHSSHYGYGTKKQGTDKEIVNPFYCVEESKWVAGKLVILQECPECQAIQMVKAQKAQIEISMQKEGKSAAEIQSATESHKNWLSKHNREFKFYANVKDSSGRYFTAKMPGKSVWKKIETLIGDYKNRRVPIDAISASQGLWFRISRSGEGFGTEYDVEVVTEEVIINGQVIDGAQKPKLAPLTVEDANKARNACMDIGDVGIRRLSLEDVKRLVSAKGDPEVVAAIFAGSDRLAPVAPAVAPAPVAPAPSAANNEDLLARARAMLVPPPPPAAVSVILPHISVTAPAAVVAPKTVTTTNDSAEADFLAQFNF